MKCDWYDSRTKYNVTEMTRNPHPDLSIVVGQVNVKNIDATWLGSWLIICRESPEEARGSLQELC